MNKCGLRARAEFSPSKCRAHLLMARLPMRTLVLATAIRDHLAATALLEIVHVVLELAAHFESAHLQTVLARALDPSSTASVAHLVGHRHAIVLWQRRQRAAGSLPKAAVPRTGWVGLQPIEKRLVNVEHTAHQPHEFAPTLGSRVTAICLHATQPQPISFLREIVAYEATSLRRPAQVAHVNGVRDQAGREPDRTLRNRRVLINPSPEH